MKITTFFVALLLLAQDFSTATAASPFDPTLKFLEPVVIPMPEIPPNYTTHTGIPDPHRPGLYIAVGSGPAVTSWTTWMWAKDTGAWRQVSKLYEELNLATKEYERTVFQEGQKVIDAKRVNFEGSVKELNRRIPTTKKTIEAYFDALKKEQDALASMEKERNDVIIRMNRLSSATANLGAFIDGLEIDDLVKEKSAIKQEVSIPVTILLKAGASLLGVVSITNPMGVAVLAGGFALDLLSARNEVLDTEAELEKWKIDFKIEELQNQQKNKKLRALRDEVEATSIELLNAEKTLVRRELEGHVTARTEAWKSIDTLAIDEKNTGVSNFFRALQNYHKLMNHKGASLYVPLFRYHQFLVRSRASDPMKLVPLVKGDIAFVKMKGTDPSGKWTSMATGTLPYLEKYNAWYSKEPKRIDGILLEFKKFTHVNFTDAMMADAYKALGVTVDPAILRKIHP